MTPKSSVATSPNESKVLTLDVVEKLSTTAWRETTDTFQQEKVRDILSECDCHATQLIAFDCILRSVEDWFGIGRGFEGQGRIEIDLMRDAIGYKYKSAPYDVPQTAESKIDYLQVQRLLSSYQATTNALSQELEANRKKEQAQQELLAASSQLQAVLEKARESDKLKKQIESLEASLKEKDNEIRQKDEQIVQLTKEADERKGLDEDERNRYEARIKELTEANVLLSHEKVKGRNSPNKLAIINELVGEMVKEAQDWEHDERQAVNSLIMNTCADDLTPETKKKVKELKKKKSVPMVGGDLVMEKHVGNQVNGVQAGATGVIVKGEDKE